MVQNPDPAKLAAAEAALLYVRPGMKLGLGTGSTAALFVEALGRRVAQGLEIVGVPTSEATRMQATRLHIPLATLDQLPELDLTIDGADEFDGRMRLIKGAGGALLREKIVASASARMVVIADRGKAVVQLGKFPLSVEVNPFGLATTTGQVQRAAASVGCEGPIRLRRTPGQTAFVTDGGHYILDCSFGAIHDPEALSLALHAVPGVVEHGLFIGLASAVIIGDTDGVEVIGWRG